MGARAAVPGTVTWYAFEISETVRVGFLSAIVVP